MPKATPEDQRIQLTDQRRKVDFDTYDVSVDELLRRVSLGRIDVAPVYQRQFRWDPQRQSRLIESVLLGIPIPPLFMATNSTADSRGTWEVVDGLQRLLTITNFMGDEATRARVGLQDLRLRLQGLDKLTTFNGVTYDSLPADLHTVLEDRPFKVIVLNDKSDIQVRFDLFERLNTGGISLSPQEIRACVFRGEFIAFLGELAQTPAFRSVVILPESKQKDGTMEDFVLRFFAYLERYQGFAHSVDVFLTNFMAEAHRDPQVAARRDVFHRTFAFLALCFPTGLRTRKGLTPVNLFEAIAVGAALALAIDPRVRPLNNPDWYRTDELRLLTTGATNSRKRVVGRIEYCRDALLRHHAELR